MIPVRVAADTTVHHVRTAVTVEPDHPLYDEPCPVCEGALGASSVALVYVGTAPEDRQGRYWTGGAVAVHTACAAPPTQDPHTLTTLDEPHPEGDLRCES